jgi:AcrR family transcriptional regulator
MVEEIPTRQRLLDQGMRLFAKQGFDATTVGQIEGAAGLQPRRGALYKHFDSKLGLLEAAVRAHLADAVTGAQQIDAIDLSALADAGPEVLRPLVRAVGQWFLDEMDRLEDLTRVFEHDSERLASLADEVREDLVNLSYLATVGILRTVAPNDANPEATALMILGPLVALRRTTWTYGAPPLNLADEPTLEHWTDIVLLVIDSLHVPAKLRLPAQ